jgi:hypothetical protein
LDSALPPDACWHHTVVIQAIPGVAPRSRARVSGVFLVPHHATSAGDHARQVRRFADTARLPMKPVWEIVRETVEHTAEAWKTLSHKDLLPAETLKIVDQQIQKIVVGMMVS